MNPLAIFAGPYAMFARIAVVAALALSVFGYGWFKGNVHGTAKLTAYQGEQAKAALKIITKQGAITERIVTQYQDRVVTRQGATQTIEKEVKVYVESKPLALSCMLDRGWVRLHDSAAAGAVPDPASPDDATPGTVSAPAALPTVTANYAACWRNSDRLELLQNWVREQAK